MPTRQFRITAIVTANTEREAWNALGSYCTDKYNGDDGCADDYTGCIDVEIVKER